MDYKSHVPIVEFYLYSIFTPTYFDIPIFSTYHTLTLLFSYFHSYLIPYCYISYSLPPFRYSIVPYLTFCYSIFPYSTDPIFPHFISHIPYANTHSSMLDSSWKLHFLNLFGMQIYLLTAFRLAKWHWPSVGGHATRTCNHKSIVSLTHTPICTFQCIPHTTELQSRLKAVDETARNEILQFAEWNLWRRQIMRFRWSYAQSKSISVNQCGYLRHV